MPDAPLATLADRYGDNRKVRCPRCRRITQADMVIDCSRVPDVAGEQHGLYWEYICDGCREWLFLTGATTRALFYGLLRLHQP